MALTTMVPGAVPDNSNDLTQLGHGQRPFVSFGGARMEYSNLDVDGGNNSDEGSTAGGGVTTPAFDSVAELRVTTSTYGVEIGQYAAAIFEMVPKSGTKGFHGDAYEFLRNDVLDTNDWFLNRQIGVCT
jgi:hypothetical protein